MRIERIITRQGHPIPGKVTQPRGPFPPELLAEPKIIYEYDRQSDSGEEDLPVEGTAQNNFKESKWFSCNACKLVLTESQTETHICGE
jgi:hypothetical protein